MGLGEQWSTALKPDGQAFDAVQIVTVPRYKTSGLSGDEWRISALVRLYRKGKVIKERTYGDVESAAKFLSWFMVETLESGGGDFGNEGNLCDQEGCSDPATVFYEKNKDWCGRCGESKELTWGKYFRKFCQEHKTRGDCGLDDADNNYVRLPGDPRKNP